MEILLFCLGSIGMTLILVDGSIFSWLRDLPEKLSQKTKNVVLLWIYTKLTALLHCHMCFGWWTGIIIGYLTFTHITLSQIFVAGCASSFLSYFAALFLNYLEAQTYISLPEEKNGK